MFPENAYSSNDRRYPVVRHESQVLLLLDYGFLVGLQRDVPLPIIPQSTNSVHEPGRLARHTGSSRHNGTDGIHATLFEDLRHLVARGARGHDVVNNHDPHTL